MTITPDGERLPDRPPLTGTIVDGVGGKYGKAIIEGVTFGVVSIKLSLGRMIFECRLMQPARFPFTIRPGSPVRIIGSDDVPFLDHVVPGLGTPDMICPVRPGDFATIFLPYAIADVREADPTAHVQSNDVIAEAVVHGRLDQ